MKRTIITIVILLAAGILISQILINNRNENEAKSAIVADASNNTVLVTVSPVSKQPVKLDFSSNGSFSPNQDLLLQSETSGRITELKVNKGSWVSKGQVLAIVESEVAALEVKRAEINFQKLKTDHERYKSSFETGGVTQAQIDEIELALQNAENQLKQSKRRLNDAAITAPISGVINDRSIEIGSYVTPGTALFEIVDVSRLKLNVNANEYQVVNIKVGDPVSITSNVFPDASFEGKVSFIAEKSDNTMRYPIEITLVNKKKFPLKSGMYAMAHFKFPEGEPKVVIDRTAFVGSVNSNQVYVYSESNHTAELREVVAGRIFGDQVEIFSGLDEGEKVITSGQINITDGADVEAVNR